MSPPTPPTRPAYTEESFASVPTPLTRFMRVFLPWQIWRFVVVNLKMIRMISKSHGS